MSELAERFAGGGRGYLCLDLHRDGDLTVPQDLHSVARVYVQSASVARVYVRSCQQGPAGLPGAVDGNSRHLGGSDAPDEAAVEVAQLDRSTVPGGERQTCLDPRLADAGTVSVLLSLTDLERRDAQPGQGVLLMSRS